MIVPPHVEMGFWPRVEIPKTSHEFRCDRVAIGALNTIIILVTHLNKEKYKS